MAHDVKSLLVTGGAGFIGANFVFHLVKHRPGVKIVVLDKLTYAGNLETLKPIEGKFHFVRGDIQNQELVEHLVSEHKIDGVINFAAESHVDRSILGPAIFVDTNVRGTLSLLEAARLRKVPRFLQVSTDEVYGSLGATGYFTEDTPLQPNSPYSASKASADVLVRSYHHTFHMDVVTTRCSNNYGPYQFPEKLIPLMIANALEDKPLPVYGDGKNVRDWLHVEDHCSALLTVLERGKAGDVYNIGGHNESANIDIVKRVLKELNKPESLIKYVTDRPGHDRRYAIDAAKIERELGWKPSYTFETGIKQTIAWYLDNKGWWERIRTGEYARYYAQQYGAR
ncbi:MAG: dTDP-glucose 4,6-dehydratase [Deltaproteobacteria bacterium]|nr:dTDP-glucose 4,6-dehydratase [Deltaproteobacteria bacterium]